MKPRMTVASSPIVTHPGWFAFLLGYFMSLDNDMSFA